MTKRKPSKRTLVALKGWKTRRRNERKRSKAAREAARTRETEKRTAEQLLLGFVDRLPHSSRRQGLESLIENNYGKKGFKFDLEGSILKVSISTTKTRKKFSVRR